MFFRIVHSVDQPNGWLTSPRGLGQGCFVTMCPTHTIEDRNKSSTQFQNTLYCYFYNAILFLSTILLCQLLWLWSNLRFYARSYQQVLGIICYCDETNRYWVTFDWIFGDSRRSQRKLILNDNTNELHSDKEFDLNTPTWINYCGPTRTVVNEWMDSVGVLPWYDWLIATRKRMAETDTLHYILIHSHLISIAMNSGRGLPKHFIHVRGTILTILNNQSKVGLK